MCIILREQAKNEKRGYYYDKISMGKENAIICQTTKEGIEAYKNNLTFAGQARLLLIFCLLLLHPNVKTLT